MIKLRNIFWWPFLVPLPFVSGLIFALVEPLSCKGGGVQWLSPTTPAVVLTVYVVLLGLVVTRYAAVSLEGDLRRNNFMINLVGTLWAVQGLVMAGNMIGFILFWMLTSFGLHRLLEHFYLRQAARIVAWEKFLVSRFGDLCLLLSAVILYSTAGTLNFVQLASLPPGGAGTGLAAGLLALGALSKSAQVPFHGWLPRTLEAPTPVSALLHAGVINAGGFLLIRFSFLVSQHADAQLLVLAAGSLSALWGGLALLVQPDIKRRLAWSTVGQMGFMMMEIGLGSPGLALIHLMGHGLYKAKSFLWSGESQKKSVTSVQTVKAWRPWLGLGIWLTVLGINLGMLGYWAPGHLVLSTVVWAALLPLVVGAWERPSGVLRSLAVGVLVLAASTILSLTAQTLFSLPEYSPSFGLRLVVGVAASVLLALTGLVTAFHPLLGRYRWYRRAYASALHGFSLGRWPEALVERLRPGKSLLRGQ